MEHSPLNGKKREYCEKRNINSFGDLERDPLFRDIDNHISPVPDLENPREVLQELREAEERIRTTKKS